jgi:hypothetical protein
MQGFRAFNAQDVILRVAQNVPVDVTPQVGE